MPDVGAAADSAADKAGGFLGNIVDLVKSTNLPKQIDEVDTALFTNPWFFVPFVAHYG